MKASQLEEFEAFVHATSPRLLRTAWYLTGDPTRAEDLVQETLTRMYVAWPKLTRTLGEPAAYAHRTLTHLHIDDVRRRSREAPSALTPDRAVGQRDADHVDIVRALAALGDRERQVVVLRHLADLPERTVADILGISVGTVKSSGADGIRKLRLALGDDHVRA